MARLRDLAAAAMLLAAAACSHSPGASRGHAPVEAPLVAGVVVVGGGSPLLIQAQGGLDVVQAAPAATRAGFGDFDEVVSGDPVRYRAVADSRGVRVADLVELAPALAAEEDRMARAADVESFVREGRLLAVDARDGSRFAAGHLPGAVPFGEVTAGSALPGDRAAPLLFYGESSRDPAPITAARKAIAEGYTDVRVLLGGIRAWSARGYASFVTARRLRETPGDGYVILDVRPRSLQEGGIPQGSVAIPLDALSPPQLTGATYPPPLVLVGSDASGREALEAADRIRRWRSVDEISAVQPVQILEGGVPAWVAAGGGLAPVSQAANPGALTAPRPDPAVVPTLEFVSAWRAGGEGRFFLDVRSRGRGTPPFAKHIPLAELHRRLGELPLDREILVFCAVGQRSRVAWEILTRNGFRARYLRDRPPER
jgi:rhodanese-related sulfurtransferase